MRFMRKVLIIPRRSSDRDFEAMLQRASEWQKAKWARLAKKALAVNRKRAS